MADRRTSYHAPRSISDESLDPWKIAQARFLEGLDEEEKLVFKEATLENLFYGASNVEREDRGASKTRSVLRRIEPLISAVEDYGKALDAYANIAPLYLAPIWGSIRVVLVIANAHSKFYCRILDTFGRIGDILPRFRDYQRIFDREKHQRFAQTLSRAYLAIITLCTEFRTLLRAQSTSSIKRMLKPLSPALNAHLEGAVERFRQHRKEVDKEAEVCNMIEEKEARGLVLRNNAAAEAREREAKQKSLISQLSKVDYEYKHRQMQRLRHSGSGAWLVELPEFKNWLDMSSSAVFCCYGIPGCGKSVLISSVIDDRLSRQADPQISPAIAFYYCNYADKRTLDPLNLFGSIAQQLLRKLKSLPPAISATLENMFEDGKRPAVEHMLHLIRFSVEALSSVIMFIDGLDEMSESGRKLVFAHLQMKELGPTTCLKIFVSSREDGSYLMASYCVPNFKTLVSANTVSKDIEMYTKSEVRALRGKGDLALGDPALEGEIVTALVDGAKGMFLWVKFQLDDLCAAETDKAIRDVLRHLPRNLGETYDRLLGRIEGPERRQYVKRMFNWILCATRPLHVNELREAIAFTIEDRHWDAAKIPNDMGRLVRACGNLVLIDEFTENVQFAHYTVAQYLLGQDGFESKGFHIDRKEAEFQIGQICVAYLSFPDFETQMTHYSNVVTPTLKILEDAAMTQSLLPPNSSAAFAAKAVGKIRGRQRSPSHINFARHAIVHHNGPSNKPLFEKFLLLSYIAKNWLSHTHRFVVEDEFPAHKVKDQRYILLFDALVLEKTLLAEFRPWGVGKRSAMYPLVEMVGWALFFNHVPLLQAVDRQATFHYFNKIGDHLQAATTSYLDEDVQIWEDSKFFPTELIFQPLYDKNDWGSWLYRNLVHGFRLGWSRVQWRQVPYPPNGLMFSFLLVDAVRLKNVSAVGEICKYFNRNQSDLVWFLTECHGFMYNPLELAALNGSEDIFHLLRTAGCPVSTSFKGNVIKNRNLFVAIEAGNIEVVKCLVAALSDALAAQPPDEINVDEALISRALDCLRMEQAQQEFIIAISGNSLNGVAYSLDSDALHCGMEEAIDLLLEDGNLRLSASEIQLLLWDAIKENKIERLNSLLDLGVGTSHMMVIPSHGNSDVELPKSMSIGPHSVVRVAMVPTLSWAILNERYEIAESLLLAGALPEDTDPDWGYTSFAFAVFTGSLPLVELLNKFGYDIKARDRFGRNIMEFASLYVRNSTKSIIRYIIDQDENYWLPIAKRVFDDNSWWAREMS